MTALLEVSDLHVAIQTVQVLRGLTLDDSRDVFAAIRLANPGGLGRSPEQDVADEPTQPLTISP